MSNPFPGDPNATPMWVHNPVTYYVRDCPQGVTPADFDQLVATAFGRWMSVCALDIIKANGSAADITIVVGPPVLPGEGGHSLIPNFSNSPIWTTIDEQIVWNGPGDLGLQSTLQHELGHVLGLFHEQDLTTYYQNFVANPNAVMWGGFGVRQIIPQQLHDITEMLSRYGPRLPTTHTVSVSGLITSATLDGRSLLP